MLLAVALSYVFLQGDCLPKSGNANLVSLEIEAGGLDRLVGFDTDTLAYSAWFDGAATFTVRATAEDPNTAIGVWMPSGYVLLGNGSGEATLDTPAVGTIIVVESKASGGTYKRFEIGINPACTGGECDDNNSCTSNACVATACEFDALPDGDPCTDQASVAGVCTAAICNTAPVVEGIPLTNLGDPCHALDESEAWLSCRFFEASQLGALPQTLDQAQADQLGAAVSTVLSVVADAAVNPVSEAEYDMLTGPSDAVCAALMAGLTCLEVIDLPVDWPPISSAPGGSSSAAITAKQAASDGVNVPGWTVSACNTDLSPPAFYNDRDGDGLVDGCEQQLATMLQPVLQFSQGESLQQRRTYWVVDPVGSLPTTEVKIFYALSYLRDGGCSWLPPSEWTGWCARHDGDSEWIRLKVSNRGDSLWRVNEVRLSAHRNAQVDRSGDCSFETLAGRPKIWVSKSKHANFCTQDDCQDGIRARLQDQCPGPGFLELALKRCADCSDQLNKNLGARVCRLVDEVFAEEDGGDCPSQSCESELYWNDSSFCGWQPMGFKCPDGYSFQMSELDLRIGEVMVDCVEVCDDGIDNDVNGDTDCADAQCAGAPGCPTSEICDDGIDNDLDGTTDCADLPDCATAPPCVACVTTADCDDGNECTFEICCPDPFWCPTQSGCGRAYYGPGFPLPPPSCGAEGTCSDAGTCECDPDACSGGTECLYNVCVDPYVGCEAVPASNGTMCNAYYPIFGECDGNGSCQRAGCIDDDECSFGDPCYVTRCHQEIGGLCSARPIADGTPCGVGYACQDGDCDPVECVIEADCTLGETCQGGVCLQICSVDTDCVGNRTCQGGVCQHVECVSDGPCYSGEICLNNVCSATCNSNSDCWAGTCQDGVCQQL